MNKASIERVYKKLAASVGVPENSLTVHGLSAMVMHDYEKTDYGLELLAHPFAISALMTHIGGHKKVTIQGIRYEFEVDGLPVIILPKPETFKSHGFDVDTIEGCQVVAQKSLFRFKLEQLRKNLTSRFVDEGHLLQMAERGLQ